ncbi:type II secretion system protein GspN [Desulfatirhabdium butyrativorans]|uniref:type II secretion system protein GspN n=1 Tax=Desulfatirhabdium butyrativorans TaxID=340467 RepID=UPI0004167144|nr:type II secretion system protein GspN [Desulfatirhabdium butyrativorans]
MNAEIRRTVFYGVFLIAALLFWVHWLFPASSVRTFLEERISTALGGQPVRIDAIHAQFPLGVLIDRIEILEQEKPLVRIESLQAGITGLNLEALNTSLSAGVAGGRIEGLVAWPLWPPRNPKIDLQLSGLHLERIEGLGNLTHRSLAGEVSGRLNQAENLWQLSLAGKDVKIGIIDATIGPIQITFANVQTLMAMETRTVHLKSASFNGTQVSGSASGAIGLSDRLDQSTPSIDATIRIHPALMSEIRNPAIRSLLSSRIDQPVSVHISGTLAHPMWTMGEGR